MAFMSMLTLTSCHSDKHVDEVLVNGVTSTSLLFEGDFNGNSGAFFKQTVNVSSNVAWSISGVPEWLSVSPQNGNGTQQISIYPKEENEAAESRSAVLTLTAGDAVAFIEITQFAKLSSVKVTPSNIVALYNRMAWDYSGTSDVDVFQYLILSKADCDRLTERDLRNALSGMEKLKITDNYITSAGIDSYGNKLVQNTKYYVITMAYDAKGNPGEIVKTEVSLPAFYDENKDAYVGYENVGCNSYMFSFDVKKRGYCDTYHIIYGTLKSGMESNPVIYAFEINYYLKHAKKHWFAENWDLEIVTNYPNDHTFTYSSVLSLYPLCVAYGWGVFKDGKLSSDLLGFQWDTSAEEARPTKIMRNNDALGILTIKRSEEEHRAKK